MNRLSDAIHFIRPEAIWVIRGTNYADLEWLDEVQTKPTESELTDALKKVEANETAKLIAQLQAKNQLLNRLGITADEAKLLLA